VQSCKLRLIIDSAVGLLTAECSGVIHCALINALVKSTGGSCTDVCPFKTRAHYFILFEIMLGLCEHLAPFKCLLLLFVLRLPDRVLKYCDEILQFNEVFSCKELVRLDEHENVLLSHVNSDIHDVIFESACRNF
jgi:hypothetical protein